MAELTKGVAGLFSYPGYAIMIAVGVLLIYLAIKKGYEPLLLLPMGFGAILANIPFSSAVGVHGPLTVLYDMGIATELFPLLIFIAIGAMIDFGPLLKNPRMLIFGGAAQFGIFFTISLTLLISFLSKGTFAGEFLNFTLKEAASIGIIGAADGPTSIYVAGIFAPHLIGPISVAAYSYMSLVPIIQPPVIRALTTESERKIRMEYRDDEISQKVKIIFPIAVTIIAGMVAPVSVSLVGFLMFGNLLRESGVTERLSKSAQSELASLVTILLGITIGSTMEAHAFLNVKTLTIIVLGLAAFIADTAGGVMFAKLMNLFTKVKINPMIGAAGISAFPMSARVVQREAQKNDPENFILMHAISANVGGQIGSIIAGGLVLALFA
jgi:carboxybiotin decarboxylase